MKIKLTGSQMGKLICLSVAEAGEIPSGNLYAMLMSEMDLEEYNIVLDILIKHDWIRRSDSHLLTIGKLEQKNQASGNPIASQS